MSTSRPSFSTTKTETWPPDSPDKSLYQNASSAVVLNATEIIADKSIICDGPLIAVK